MAIVVERPGPDAWARVRAVRLAALADTPDAFGSTLVAEAWQPESFWRDRLAAADVTTLLAILDGRDAGITVVAPTDDATTAGIYSVWVAPFARGRGVGDALIEAAVRDAGDRGFRRVILDVGDHNAAAQALYRRHGFTPSGRRGSLPPPREHVTEHELERTLD